MINKNISFKNNYFNRINAINTVYFVKKTETAQSDNTLSDYIKINKSDDVSSTVRFTEKKKGKRKISEKKCDFIFLNKRYWSYEK